MSEDPTAGEPRAHPPAGYLDAVGGQPLAEPARRAWLAAAEQAWSDPARLHHQGRRAGLLLDTARQSIAASLGIDRDEAYWTSSGPTAVATALQGLLRRGGRLAASGVESLAVLSPARALASEVELIAVDRDGRIDLADLDRVLADPPAALAVQAANPEVGTRQPLAEVHERARRAGVPLLVHAVQVIGRDPMPVHWDVLAASARDWAGPAGVGVLAVRRHLAWAPEENPDRGWVGGFPDVPGAVAAATALEQLLPWASPEADRLRGLSGQIRERLPAIVDGVEVVGDPDDRLPHIVTFTCTGVTGETVVDELARRGFSVASGSACTSDVRLPSQVLAAMGIAAEASVRVSLPFGCTPETVDGFLAALPQALAAARAALA